MILDDAEYKKFVEQQSNVVMALGIAVGTLTAAHVLLSKEAPTHAAILGLNHAIVSNLERISHLVDPIFYPMPSGSIGPFPSDEFDDREGDRETDDRIGNRGTGDWDANR